MYEGGGGGRADGGDPEVIGDRDNEEVGVKNWDGKKTVPGTWSERRTQEKAC